jgi:CRP/FNR family transcriptional regulator
MTAETILKSCGLFAGVGGASRQTLLDMAVVRRFGRAEAIFQAGDPCPGVFIVGAGLVRVFLASASGKEQILHLTPPGGTFAEVAAIGGFACPANASAVEASTCLLLPNDPFRRALQQDHQLCVQLLGSFAGWVRRFVALLEDVTLRDAAGRVARYLLASAPEEETAIRLPGLKRHLASHLNLANETLSRTLRRLSDAGLIVEDESGGLEIVNREGLRLMADGGE